jgi:hypothetical protein
VETGQPLSTATSRAVLAMSTGGPERELTRGTMKITAAMSATMTTSERAMLGSEPMA